MVITVGFIKSDEVAESFWGPELAGTFEPALLLAAS
jgi:hypothetical protein